MRKEKISERIKKIRGDMSQEKFADILEVTKAAVSNYETGERIPRDEVKKKIADFANQTVDSIFFD